MTNRRQWGLVAIAVAGALIVGSILWTAFASDPAPDSSRSGGQNGPVWEAEEPQPEFSIPKIPDCVSARAAELSAIAERLKARTVLSTSARVEDGDDVYVAAILAYDDEPVDREPGLWVLRGEKVYAVGDSTAYSAFPSAADLGIHGDRDAATKAVACAAGY